MNTKMIILSIDNNKIYQYLQLQTPGARLTGGLGIFIRVSSKSS